MRLFVDDTREFPPLDYQCCRDYDSAVMLLSILKFTHISLDYSLGKDNPNGLDVLRYMKEHNIFVPEINIHSNHTVGRERMREYAENNFPDSKVTTATLPK